MFSYLTISGLLSLTTWILLFLPNFLADRGWSLQRVGWAIGLYFLLNLVSQIFAGGVAERSGYVRTALKGAYLGIAGGVLYLASLWITELIFAARLLHAIAAALIFSGALMQLVRSVPSHLHGRMIGYFGLPGFIMMGGGPIIAEWFIHQWGFTGIFLSIPVLFAIIAWLLSRLPRPLAPRGLQRPPFQEAFRASFSPLRPIWVFSVLFGFCFAAWNTFIAPAVSAVGTGGVSGFGLGYAVGAVMTRLGISHRLDTGSRRLLAISTLIPYGICLAMIPQATGVLQLLGLGFVCGMVHGTYYPSLSSIAAERFHPLHMGQAMSLYISANAFGMFIGPPLWGAIADRAGYPFTFAAAGLLMAAGTAAFVFEQRRPVPSEMIAEED